MRSDAHSITLKKNEESVAIFIQVWLKSDILINQ